MHARWEALHEAFVHHVSAADADGSFNALLQTAPVLAAYGGSTALAATFRRIPETADELGQRDRVLRALIQAAQRGPRDPGRLALALLWLALWPALTGIFRWHIARSGDAGEAISDLSERFITMVLGLRLDGVTRAGATLAWNTARTVTVARRRHQPRAQEWLSPAVDRAVPPLSPEHEAQEISAWAGAVIGTDTALFMEIAVGGRTYDELATTTGLNADAIRKRFKRACLRLREQAVIDSERSSVRIAVRPPHQSRAGLLPEGGR